MLLLFLLLIFPYSLDANYTETNKNTTKSKGGGCGIKYSPFKATIGQGFDAKQNEFPWHVALYKMNSTGHYIYQCGGSIIDNYIVVTAAHCVFNENKRDLDYNKTIIATGKHNSSWEHRDVYEQRFEVITKKVLTTYSGFGSRYQDDIALLGLNDSIKFSSIVMPVCIDWEGSFEPNQQDSALFAGWGYNEKNVLNEILQFCTMKQINFGDCRDRVKIGYTSYLTSDKFCSYSSDYSTLEKGDSGGGLMFYRNGSTEVRYYIKGVLSGKPVNSSLFFFTNISSHMPWIKKTMMIIRDEVEASKVCGITNLFNQTEQGGYIDSYTDYPWLATIYMTKKNKFFGIRCVGTIIHQKAIITNNWCISDSRPPYKDVEFRILVGKHELNMKKVEKHQQFLEIVQIHKQQNYIDWNARAENDLVILIVNNEIKFNKTVAPICIDRDRQFPINGTSVGMITSWNIDECHCQVTANYSYLDTEDCSQAFSDTEEYETYVTSDKVCGKYVNGTHFIHGNDIGAGYVFTKNGTTKHYLQGVVSKGRPKHHFSHEFLIFTNVELNLRWMSDTMLKVYEGSW